MKTPANILTIAGSDSGGGAGIQADLKTITLMGCYGLSVITALTAQNTTEVADIHAPPADFTAKQLGVVLEDIPVAAAKTGMLFSEDIVRAVAEALGAKTFPLVVDPVCVSHTGARLLKPEAEKAMWEVMLPLADLVTPNRHEAELMAGMKIETPEDIAPAAVRILDMGASAVLIKGGHFEGEDIVDWLCVPGQAPRAMPVRRIMTGNTHGTGCVLSAAVASALGMGMDLYQAVRAAQKFLNLGLRAAYKLGRGEGPPNLLARYFRVQEERKTLEELSRSAARLLGIPDLFRLIPEVRMNLALALPWAESVDDVAAFSGRITCSRSGRVMIPGCPEFGASSHMAKVVLAAARYRPDIRSAANIRFSQDTVKAVQKAGLTLAWFDRAGEPDSVKQREGSSLEWGTSRAFAEAIDPRQVDAVADRGEPGKEPMIRVLGKDSLEVADRLRRIAESMRSF